MRVESSLIVFLIVSVLLSVSLCFRHDVNEGERDERER